MTSRGSTFHVILACMLGAFACSTVAIWAGYHIGFGIVAGLIVGYLAYDFRSVLKAVPVAFAEFSQWATEKRLDLIAFKSALTPSAVVALTVAACGFGPLALRNAAAGRAGICTLLAIAIVACAVILTSFLYVITTLFAAIGIEYVEKVRIWRGLNEEVVGMTYARYWTVVAKGFGLALKFLLWRMWAQLFVMLIGFIVLAFHGLWKLFVLVHRYERLLCAIDGTLGGVLAYELLIRPDRTFTQNAIAVLFGMVVGAAWGVLNYEILSKRVLKVVPVTAQ
jgi:hypothetical protein